MDIYIARQPIFDRNMRIYAYELLYRQSNMNYFTGIDDDQATAELVYNSFMVIGLKDLTEGAKAFINFSKDLIDSDFPLMLPNDSVVIEILERDEATESTMEACKRLKSLGYRLALDDFIFDENNLPLVDIADIIKVEFSSVSHEAQRKLIKKHRHKLKFLAEKIETREDYQLAVELGYDFFQGYFFSRPAIISSKEIVSLNVNLFNIIEELKLPEPRYEVIADIIQTDLGLSYKLLKLTNSVYFGTRNKIKSIHQALSYLGMNELYKWISLMMIKDLQNIENAELIKQSLIRGKLMELMASELRTNTAYSEYFFTGMFSSIDILLNKSMEEILKGLSLSNEVKEALLGEDNDQKKLLDCIIECEKANWSKVENEYPMNRIDAQRFMTMYLDAIKWVKKLNY